MLSYYCGPESETAETGLAVHQIATEARGCGRASCVTTRMSRSQVPKPSPAEVGVEGRGLWKRPRRGLPRGS